MSAVAERVNELRASDRCDRCGARAYVKVYIPVGPRMVQGELLFCSHHYRRHEEAMKDYSVTDERPAGMR